VDLATQSDQILKHLKSGQTITPLEALRRFGCFRLGARIYDLKQEGHAIEKQMVDVGKGKRVASYRIASGGKAPS
jgi:hypothetical protein